MPDDGFKVSTRPMPAGEMAEQAVKRPGMYFGRSSYPAAVAFIETYTIAIQDVRDALSGACARPPSGGIQDWFARGLESEGRLRWGDWRYSIAAEVMQWTGDHKPSFDLMTVDQEKEAIRRLRPLTRAMYALPRQVVDEVNARNRKKSPWGDE